LDLRTPNGKRSIMHRTVFETPVLRTIMKLGGGALLKVLGWKGVYKPKRPKKYFAIFAPHTSNWDFPILISIALKLDIRSYWMGKNSLFKRPYGWFFKWLGGIPIDRSRSVNTVDQFIGHFNDHENLVLVNAPEGTRSRVGKWKSGFYHIATGASVPIALVYLDYKEKIGGIGQIFHTTGDYEKDMDTIMDFYRSITPKHPEKFVTS